MFHLQSIGAKIVLKGLRNGVKTPKSNRIAGLSKMEWIPDDIRERYRSYDGILPLALITALIALLFPMPGLAANLLILVIGSFMSRKAIQPHLKGTAIVLVPFFGLRLLHWLVGVILRQAEGGLFDQFGSTFPRFYPELLLEPLVIALLLGAASLMGIVLKMIWAEFSEAHIVPRFSKAKGRWESLMDQIDYRTTPKSKREVITGTTVPRRVVKPTAVATPTKPLADLLKDPGTNLIGQGIIAEGVWEPISNKDLTDKLGKEKLLVQPVQPQNTSS